MAAVCIHHNDPDGRASAAIVRRALGPQTHCYEMNYGDPVPWKLAQAAGAIVVVDFSLPPADMQRLAALGELTWIDHHVSTIKEIGDLAQAWLGVRDTGEAACVLTWRYFFPDKPLPRAIQLIGDRDIWRWAEADTGPFDEALQLQDTNPRNEALWQPLLEDDPAFVDRLVAQGQVLRAAHLHEVHQRVKNYAFPVKFEGYPALAINARGNGDIGHHILSLGYRLAYCYIDNQQNGQLMTFVTLFSEDVDVSAIAQRFGGGGHRGAAGFSFVRGPSPFPPGARVEF